MPDFTRLTLQILHKGGCSKTRDGKHEIWYSPITDLHFSVPRKIRSRHTANEILKQAGLEKAF